MSDTLITVIGIFLAAVGIHESAWGTSKLAIEKNNLFGMYNGQ